MTTDATPRSEGGAGPAADAGRPVARDERASAPVPSEVPVAYPTMKNGVAYGAQVAAIRCLGRLPTRDLVRSEGSFVVEEPHRIERLDVERMFAPTNIAELRAAVTSTLALMAPRACRAIRRDTTFPVATPLDAVRLFREGWTLHLENIDQVSSTFLDATRRLSDAIGGSPARANVYVSPSGSDPALAPHADASSSLIVQLLGRKRWTLSRPRLSRLGWTCWPDEQLQTAVSPQGHASPTLDIELAEGDGFWLPRGWIHSAVASDAQTSIHMTAMVFRPTLADVLAFYIDALPEAVPRLETEVWPILDSNVTDQVGEVLTEMSERYRSLDPETIRDIFWAWWWGKHQGPRGSIPDIGAVLDADRAVRFAPVAAALLPNRLLLASGIRIDLSPEEHDIVAFLLSNRAAVLYAELLRWFPSTAEAGIERLRSCGAVIVE